MQWMLASKSPRRKELLAMLLPSFETTDAHVDESAIKARHPKVLAKKLAKAKAGAAAQNHPGKAIIACDTVVELNGEALGKPKSKMQAVAMLHRLAGRTHKVHTGVCVVLPGQKKPYAWFTSTTWVRFGAIPPAQLLQYAATPEPYDKAGGYGIQGWAAKYIKSIQGCYYNVMGLPVAALYQKIHGLL